MRNNTVKALFAALTLCAASIVVIAFGGVVGNSQSKAGGGGGRIEGTWDVQVSIVNCETGALIRSFLSIGSFNKGGTLIDSTSGVPQSRKTPGHGVWAHTTGNNYVFRFKSFSFDASGNYTGYTIIRHEAALDQSGDSYTSAGTAEIYAPNGTLVANICSTTVATRFGL